LGERKERFTHKQLAAIRVLFMRGPMSQYALRKELEKELGQRFEHPDVLRIIRVLQKDGRIRLVGVKGPRKAKLYDVTLRGVLWALAAGYLTLPQIYEKTSTLLRALLKVGLVRDVAGREITYSVASMLYTPNNKISVREEIRRFFEMHELINYIFATEETELDPEKVKKLPEEEKEALKNFAFNAWKNWQKISKHLFEKLQKITEAVNIKKKKEGA